jgi:hypothetical protein
MDVATSAEQPDPWAALFTRGHRSTSAVKQEEPPVAKASSASLRVKRASHSWSSRHNGEQGVLHPDAPVAVLSHLAPERPCVFSLDASSRSLLADKKSLGKPLNCPRCHSRCSTLCDLSAHLEG